MPEQTFYTLIQSHPTEATIVFVVLSFVFYRFLANFIGEKDQSNKKTSLSSYQTGDTIIDIESQDVSEKKKTTAKIVDVEEVNEIVQNTELLIDANISKNNTSSQDQIDEDFEENIEKNTLNIEQVLVENVSIPNNEDKDIIEDVTSIQEDKQEPKVEEPKVFVQPQVEVGFFKRGLQKSRGFLSQILPSVFGAEIDEDVMEDFEDSLLAADVGPDITDAILNLVRKTAQKGGNIREALRTELLNRLGNDIPLKAYSDAQQPHVIMVVGVNGSGKTTTIGKLAHRFVQEGRKVLLAPGDTFRAGAVAQLKTWAERSGADFVEAKQDSDAAAVIYSAIERAQKQNYDIVICDTAGRLQAQTTLMDELAKIVRVSKKLIPEAPHETILVLDSTIGQNALFQAEGFGKVADITGVALTKLDGSAKGGVVIAVRDKLGLPIQLIGLGESLEALQDFHSEHFVDALLDDNA